MAVQYDEQTGEVLEPAPQPAQDASGGSGRGKGRPRHPKRPLSPEEAREAADRQAWLERRQGARDRELAVLERILPVVRLPGDPPVQHAPLLPWDERTSQGELIVEGPPRLNESTVRVVRRSYDGEAGGPCVGAQYISLHVLFRTGAAGTLRRTQGLALISRDEVRTVRDALERALGQWPEGEP
jgi:hypothetical protein